MKITESQLKLIITEEINELIESGEIDEGWLDRMKARGAAATTQAGSYIKGGAQKAAGKLARATGATAGGELAGIEGEETQAAGKEKAQTIKTRRIAQAHSHRLKKDLRALGIVDVDSPIWKAIETLDDAIAGLGAPVATTRQPARAAAQQAAE